MYNKHEQIPFREVAAVNRLDQTTPKPSANHSTLDWHSGFYATIRIELDSELSHLLLEREHQLTSRPLRIDAVVIKKPPDYHVQKNIGRIFRGHNIIEYKSPDDYLSVDDGYKALSYALLYKTDSDSEDSISIDNITLTLVSYRRPDKLLAHWRQRAGCRIECPEAGIYYIVGTIVPIQIIVQQELSSESNLWLKCLTNKLEDAALIGQIIKQTTANKKDERYDAYSELVSQANKAFIEEAMKMGLTVLQEIIEETGAYKPYAEKAAKQARQEERLAVARSLLHEGAEVAFVAKITKLSVDEVKALANSDK